MRKVKGFGLLTYDTHSYYSGSNKCPNVCMFSTKVDTPQHLLTRALTCEYIE
jgi:hypothetical protein